MKIPKKIDDMKKAKYYKPIKYLLLIMLLIVFLDRCTWMAMPPWKETDPTKPGFNAENFEYEDYLNGHRHQNMLDVLSVLFPLGTSRDDVEKILLKYGNGYHEKRDTGQDCYVFRSRPTIYFIFSVDAPYWGHVCFKYQNGYTNELRFNGQFIYPRGERADG